MHSFSEQRAKREQQLCEREPQPQSQPSSKLQFPRCQCNLSPKAFSSHSCPQPDCCLAGAVSWKPRALLSVSATMTPALATGPARFAQPVPPAMPVPPAPSRVPPTAAAAAPALTASQARAPACATAAGGAHAATWNAPAQRSPAAVAAYAAPMARARATPLLKPGFGGARSVWSARSRFRGRPAPTSAPWAAAACAMAMASVLQGSACATLSTAARRAR